MRGVAALVTMLLASGCRERAPKEVQIPVPPPPAPLAGAPAAPHAPLLLGRPPHLTEIDVRTEYEPFAHYLGEAAGTPIRLRVTDTYGAVIDELVAGELQLAMLPAIAYVEAKERLPELRLLATIVGEGTPRYRGYIVTAAAKPWRTLAELRGKRFAFVDRHSGSGYVFPLALLRDSGIEPERDFGTIVYAGSHPRVVERVLGGEIDAGAISSTTLHHMRAANVAPRLRIIAKTDWIPFDGVVAHPSVPQATCDRLQQVMLGLSVRTAQGRAVLTGITTTSGFVPPNDRAYDAVRAMLARVREPAGGR